MTGILDRLPAPVRHLIIIFASTLLGSIVQAVVGAGGVTDVDWAAAAIAALNSAAVAAAAGVAALYALPQNAQYGFGKVSA